MLFNSFHFLLFFIAVVTLVFACPPRFRWIVLLAASAYFYMCWNYRYIVFLATIILVDYVAGLGMAASRTQRQRRLALAFSLVSNLGMLFVFKYFNFFSINASALLHRQLPTLAVVLPIGLSFHVFQSLAYTIDVYRGRQEAERHLGIFALYVLFFPQLVAGPIERPQNLLHQFHEEKRWNYDRFRSGAQLALWGLVKKVCIADLLSQPVAAAFDDPAAHSGPVLLLATAYFAIQIYCDFSGYTDIARGIARIFGYELMVNFRQPYFARSMREFWQRWHISLSTWFRDYVYIPLGGSRVPRWRVLLNLMTVFVLSGLWHGAAWTFVIWGAIHGTYMVIGEITSSFRERLFGPLRQRTWFQALQMIVTFNLVMIGWVFFRAETAAKGWYILSSMYMPGPINFERLSIGLAMPHFESVLTFLWIAALLLVDAWIVWQPSALMHFWERRFVRSTAYAAGVFALALFGIWTRIEFIYFQF